MGYCLFAQGFFSVVYHVCPTNLSLQYDTTMMYVMCVLCYVKIYQNRHPDASANAFSTMFILGKFNFYLANYILTYFTYFKISRIVQCGINNLVKSRDMYLRREMQSHRYLTE